MASPALLRACLDVMHFTGLSKLLRKQFQGLGSIFCFHHVRPGGGMDKGFAPNGKIECTPEFLSEIIHLVRKRGMETLSLADAVERIRNPKPNQMPFAVFTLDDGYKDNMVYGQPVFDQLNCPYTVFVAPKIVDGSCELWWRALEKIVAANTQFKATVDGIEFLYDLQSEAQKQQAWNILFPKLAALPEYEQRKTVHELAEKFNFNLVEYCKSVAMNWDEIRKLNEDPLCTIGAHTMNHYAVAKLSAADCLYELEESRRIIERELGKKIHFFAYPYGDEPAAGPRDFQIANDLGYTASLTTRKGVVFAGHGKHLHALPRIMVSGRYQKIRYIDALISGAPTALLNRFSKINVN
jgi:peptidoglycan/xylan/chitin deacetylase (PgdA/CDA1 family)